MDEKEALQLFAKLESETALRAFESWISLEWARFFMQSALIGSVVLTVCVALLFMAWKEYKNG